MGAPQRERGAGQRLVSFAPDAPGLTIVSPDTAADIVAAPGDYPVVSIAAHDLARDIESVSGRTPRVAAASRARDQIWVGTLGHMPAIDHLVAAHHLDIGTLKGAWESFVIATLDRPAPGVDHALVIVGSDRRGTAYGVYELSRAIGVSPWHWWADVKSEHHAVIHAVPGSRRYGPPSVKYRGIFLNDEDWGLEPWAAATYEPENGTIGPKTYARVFDLMLRLKADLVWPAMHKVTRAFNADPRNAALADRYAIVMGSSHAEPMLRNNVGEWTAPPEAFNYLTNRAGVAEYWRARVEANAQYENIWTLGMRGIHDSGMVGPTTDAARRQTLEQIFADQRAMLKRYVNRDLDRVPQVFTPYKEVLDIYRSGLKVPDDVTLMWPDDNFGYIRHMPDAAERQRPGGSGVYYHLSYLGAPLSYLWLSTTPPALIREELDRAWDNGARQMWVFNVGDLKPAELDIDYAMRLAWDVPGTRALTIDAAVTDWAAANLDRAAAPDIAAVLAEAQRLNFERRPEHLQWWLPGEKPRPSPYSIPQADARVADFATLAAKAKAIAARIAPDRQNAYFELVTYPVTAAWLANRRYFSAETQDKLRDTDPGHAAWYGADARAADAELTALTRRYNDEIAGGKWRGIMAVEPADGQWKSFRISPPVLPAASPIAPVAPPPDAPSPSANTVTLEAEAADPAASRDWKAIDGLGRNGTAAAGTGPDARLAYRLTLPPGIWRAAIELLPTYATKDGEPLRLALSIDGGPATPIAVERHAGDHAWALAVLDNRIAVPVPGSIAGGEHRITLTLPDTAVVVDRLVFTRGQPRSP
ncbi:MAG: glycosyl hydrolase 115 family protein [Sphingomonas sp.]